VTEGVLITHVRYSFFEVQRKMLLVLGKLFDVSVYAIKVIRDSERYFIFLRCHGERLLRMYRRDSALLLSLFESLK